MNTTDTAELDNIFKTLNGSGAHACYCQRSTDGGCKCALKDEYLVEAKAVIQALIERQVLQGRLDEADYWDPMISKFIKVKVGSDEFNALDQETDKHITDLMGQLDKLNKDGGDDRETTTN